MKELEEKDNVRDDSEEQEKDFEEEKNHEKEEHSSKSKFNTINDIVRESLISKSKYSAKHPYPPKGLVD